MLGANSESRVPQKEIILWAGLALAVAHYREYNNDYFLFDITEVEYYMVILFLNQLKAYPFYEKNNIC